MASSSSPFTRLQVLTEDHYEGVRATATKLASYTDEYSASDVRFQLDGFSPMSMSVVHAICEDIDLEEDAHQWLYEYLSSPGSEGSATEAHYRVLTMIEHGFTARKLREHP